MGKNEYRKYLQEAQSIVLKAGELLQKYHQKVHTVKYKDKADVVTNADLASENLILRLLQEKFPRHGIYSEEAGESEEKEYTWVVDPLDGSKEYARGLTEYNCLLALEHHAQPVIGVIHRLGIGELYTCIRGQGAFLNQQPIAVSNTHELDISLVGIHLPTGSTPRKQIRSMLKLLEELIITAYRVRPGWDEAKMLGWVARGIIDGHIATWGIKNEWYDVAPGILLVEEAGGMVTDMSGKPIVNRNLTNGLVASNGKIHANLLQLIATCQTR